MRVLCGTILAVLATAVAAAETPQPAFSFKYGDRAVTGAKSTMTGELEISLPERRSSTVLLYRYRKTTEAETK